MVETRWCLCGYDTELGAAPVRSFDNPKPIKFPNEHGYRHRSRLRDSPNHSFGNNIYNIRTDTPIPSDNELPQFGFRYVFWLKDAVENVPEFLVLWDQFVR
jgi:hypothetical protein